MQGEMKLLLLQTNCVQQHVEGESMQSSLKSTFNTQQKHLGGDVTVVEAPQNQE